MLAQRLVEGGAARRAIGGDVVGALCRTKGAHAMRQPHRCEPHPSIAQAAPTHPSTALSEALMGSPAWCNGPLSRSVSSYLKMQYRVSFTSGWRLFVKTYDDASSLNRVVRIAPCVSKVIDWCRTKALGATCAIVCT